MKTIRGADYCDIIPSARPFFRLRRTDRLWLRRHFRNVLRVFDRVVVVIIRRRRRFRDGSIGLDIGRTKTLPGTYTFVNKRTATTTVRSFTRSVNSSAPVFDVREKRTRSPPPRALGLHGTLSGVSRRFDAIVRVHELNKLSAYLSSDVFGRRRSLFRARLLVAIR